MTYANIRVNIAGPVATLTLNRPDQLNALSPALFREAGDALEAMPEEVRVIVVAGAGRAFSAGADLKVLSDPEFRKTDDGAFQRHAVRFVDMLGTVAQVTIAKVHGLCLTGGLEVALGCDLIVAADEAQFADTHAKIGFRPRWGLTQRLPRRVGIQRAREMSLTARMVGGREAAAIGLALESVPAPQLDARVDALVAAILANSARSLPIYKALYAGAQNHFLDEGARFEADYVRPRG
ncbi:MAG: enoyl-CoA hydratase/isomerase family protein [Sphingomonadaceae bacterium]|nr:enoyl-CoA hydratase/isomerase family protein [Sphingomonadaceae bacterium]